MPTKSAHAKPTAVVTGASRVLRRGWLWVTHQTTEVRSVRLLGSWLALVFQLVRFLFGEHLIDCLLERGQVTFHDLKYALHLDMEVLVCDEVSQSGDVLPWHLWSLCAGLVREMLDRLADHDELIQQRIV